MAAYTPTPHQTRKLENKIRKNPWLKFTLEGTGEKILASYSQLFQLTESNLFLTLKFGVLHVKGLPERTRIINTELSAY